jgi:hypothetical protein
MRTSPPGNRVRSGLEGPQTPLHPHQRTCCCGVAEKPSLEILKIGEICVTFFFKKAGQMPEANYILGGWLVVGG